MNAEHRSAFFFIHNVQFNGTKYAYLHNLQGDIVGIVDSDGNEVVKYIHDPWGKILSTSGSLASTLGTIQPFRYRGYVYDEETGLYYLRSRYYQARLCRFINADFTLYEYMAGHNLFAYCNSNPINQIDQNGQRSRNLPIPGWPKWTYRVEYKNGKYIGNGQFIPHLHIYDPEKVEFAINLDGSAHDKKRAKRIEPGTDAYDAMKALEAEKLWPPKNFTGGSGNSSSGSSSSSNNIQHAKMNIFSSETGTAILPASALYSPFFNNAPTIPNIQPSNASSHIFNLAEGIHQFGSMLENMEYGGSSSFIDQLCYSN